jgi:hypothetical protein
MISMNLETSHSNRSSRGPWRISSLAAVGKDVKSTSHIKTTLDSTNTIPARSESKLNTAHSSQHHLQEDDVYIY